ncbi:hypothetical protein C5E51_23865 [Nocardia nova]|nr:hypothetical protein C5E51_23865 [Nocardia nova]
MVVRHGLRSHSPGRIRARIHGRHPSFPAVVEGGRGEVQSRDLVREIRCLPQDVIGQPIEDMGVVDDLVGLDVQRLIGRTGRRTQQLARGVVHDPTDHAVDDMLERLDRLPEHLDQNIADQHLLHHLANLARGSHDRLLDRDRQTVGDDRRGHRGGVTGCQRGEFGQHRDLGHLDHHSSRIQGIGHHTARRIEISHMRLRHPRPGRDQLLVGIP